MSTKILGSQSKLIWFRIFPNSISSIDRFVNVVSSSSDSIGFDSTDCSINSGSMISCIGCDSSIFVDMISYYDGMGPALYRLCNFDSSLNIFVDSLIQDPNDVRILVNAGSAIGKLGDFSKAIFYYDLALDADSSFLPAKNNKANALANLGNLDDAILLYQEILDENPTVTTQKNLKTALSLVENSQNKINTLVQTPVENIDSQESTLVEKNSQINNEKQKPVDFFEQVNSVFSSFSTFFNFLN